MRLIKGLFNLCLASIVFILVSGCWGLASYGFSNGRIFESVLASIVTGLVVVLGAWYFGDEKV